VQAELVVPKTPDHSTVKRSLWALLADDERQLDALQAGESLDGVGGPEQAGRWNQRAARLLLLCLGCTQRRISLITIYKGRRPAVAYTDIPTDPEQVALGSFTCWPHQCEPPMADRDRFLPESYTVSAFSKLAVRQPRDEEPLVVGGVKGESGRQSWSSIPSLVMDNNVCRAFLKHLSHSARESTFGSVMIRPPARPKVSSTPITDIAPVVIRVAREFCGDTPRRIPLLAIIMAPGPWPKRPTWPVQARLASRCTASYTRLVVLQQVGGKGRFSFHRARFAKAK
jgi:hypothetical protein